MSTSNISATDSSPARAASPSAAIVDLRRSASERLRITLREYRGRMFIDMRVWFATDSGEYQASSKGITLRPDQVAEVCQGLVLAARAAESARTV